MKNNKTNNAPGGPRVLMVRFGYTHPTASTFAVAGTSNNWRPDSTPMLLWGDGRWLIELPLAPGTYEYRLVVDGEWMADPQAKESVPNHSARGTRFSRWSARLKVRRRTEKSSRTLATLPVEKRKRS